MVIDDDACYRALCARDARFDGVFFVGVRSTGIYCRPVCTARTPGRSRCRFFDSAARAEQSGFRPCLRCRPELAPGHAPIDAMRNMARVAAARIEAGALGGGNRLADLAAELGIGERQLRRAIRAELGVSPIELAQTSRLLFAKRLLAETRLPITQVAFASGFDSLRRFNAAFRARYRLAPGTMRRSAEPAEEADTLRLMLAYRPPLAWRTLLKFLTARAIAGVECVTDECYQRTVAIGPHRGWLRVSQLPERHLLQVELAAALVPVLSAVLARLRNLFDLDARPDVISRQLAGEPLLRDALRRVPGLRVPGAFDPFELAVRAVLGQQVSVRGASTLAARMAERFGEAADTPLPCLNRHWPSAAAIAASRPASIARIGLPASRAAAMVALARAVEGGAVRLESGADPAATIEKLVQLPGIGPWTAEYIGMRALRWPDAFPASDLGLIKAAGQSSARELAALAERWRPWRAYAAMLLWCGAKPSNGRKR